MFYGNTAAFQITVESLVAVPVINGDGVKLRLAIFPTSCVYVAVLVNINVSHI